MRRVAERASRPFVILDRDGTLNVERRYLSDPHGVELLPGALRGLQRMVRSGLGLIVVTNQSGIARGYLDLRRLDAIHARLNALLAEGGVSLDGIFFCPHHPDERCECRKPEAGMVLKAAAQLGFEPQEAFVIGDNACDIELGQRLGAFTIVVTTGYGAELTRSSEIRADAIVCSLEEAARVIETCLAARKTGSAS